MKVVLVVQQGDDAEVCFVPDVQLKLFSPWICLNAHSLSSSLSLAPCIFRPPHALMSSWAPSKDIHYRNTELIPPLSLLLSPLTCSPNQASSLPLFSTLLGEISRSRAQGRGVTEAISVAEEKSSSFVQTDSIIFPGSSRGEPVFS